MAKQNLKCLVNHHSDSNMEVNNKWAELSWAPESLSDAGHSFPTTADINLIKSHAQSLCWVIVPTCLLSFKHECS